MKLSHTFAALMISLVVAGTADAAPKKRAKKHKKAADPVCEAVEHHESRRARRARRARRRAMERRRAAEARREAERRAEAERCRRIAEARRRRAAEACRPKPVHVIKVACYEAPRPKPVVIRCAPQPKRVVTRCERTTRHTAIARLLHQRHEVHHRHLRGGLAALHQTLFGR